MYSHLFRSLFSSVTGRMLPLLFAALSFLVISAAAIPHANAQENVMNGRASFYADRFEGRATASGDTFSNSDMTAAHRSLPFGTKVQVTNLRNGRNAIVTINDRGPYVGNRLIDLTHRAASRLGMVENGVQQVRLTVLN